MITIAVKLLGSLREGRENSTMNLEFRDGATVAELITRLKSLDIDPDSDQIIISLDGRGIHQYQLEHPLQTGDEVIVFPNISGG